MGVGLEDEMKFEFNVPWKRGYTAGNFFTIDAGSERATTLTIYLTEEQAKALRDRDVRVTFEPVQTREERLREARLNALESGQTSFAPFGNQGAIHAILDVIERVDAEFAKENPG